MCNITLCPPGGAHLLRELPVVEVHQVAFRISPDNKIDIMYAGHIRYIRGNQCPTVTTPGTWNPQRGDLLSLQASQSHLQGDGIVVGGAYTRGEFSGSFFPEIDISYFDIASVPVGSHKYPHLVVLRRFEPLGVGDGLGSVHYQRIHCCHSFTDP